MGSFSIWHWLIVLAIVVLVFGTVALIVIGPEKLPRVARTVGHLLGKAQRYVADVKAEVNRSIELEELKKMKTQFEDAAREVEPSVHKEMSKPTAALEKNGRDPQSALPGASATTPPAESE